uniref:Uncharacterized protein n=1 Tax=Anguilla anguilla TaxID=7936 RepID=A0A0E9X475_ANGAN
MGQESAESLFSITQSHIMGQVSSNVPHKGCRLKAGPSPGVQRHRPTELLAPDGIFLGKKQQAMK